MTEKSDILVEVKNLQKYFPVKRGVFRKTVGYVKAVDRVSLTIERGKTLGLVGETGSGKTTLGRLLLRLLPSDSGEVRFEEKDVLSLRGRGLKDLRREMQIIFQDPYGSLNPRMKVGDIVIEGVRNFRRLKRGEGKETAAELLETVGLPPGAAGLYPHEFSGGQRQRIGIARAIALQPKFIVCDEPVSSLDVSIQAQILNLLADLQGRLGLTYLFIAHDLSVVEHIADRVAVMYRGRIVEEANRVDLYRDPLHPYTRTLLESIPVPDPSAPPPGRGEEDEQEEVTAGGGCLFAPRCPRRETVCEEKAPELKPVGEGHLVACFRQKDF